MSEPSKLTHKGNSCSCFKPQFLRNKIQTGEAKYIFSSFFHLWVCSSQVKLGHVVSKFFFLPKTQRTQTRRIKQEIDKIEIDVVLDWIYLKPLWRVVSVFYQNCCIWSICKHFALAFLSFQLVTKLLPLQKFQHYIHIVKTTNQPTKSFQVEVTLAWLCLDQTCVIKRV